MPTPNILVLFSDQQRWDTLSCVPGCISPGLTPHLDGLAAGGVRCATALTPQPLCGPVRSCLQTGRWPTELGTHVNDRRLPADADTLARRLRAAGYQTGYIGKWHLASQGAAEDFRTRAVPRDRRGGYDDFWLAADVLEFTSHGYDGRLFDGDDRAVEFTGYRVDALTDHALRYLATRDGGQPWFLFLSWIEPHHQNDRHAYEGPLGSPERFARYRPPGDLPADRGDWERWMPDYLGCCNRLDDAVGRILREIDRLGMRDDTLVVYTSDHGCHFRTRNREYKRSCHDASLRVPLILQGPGFAGGVVRDEPVSLLDLPATLLHAAGLELPAHWRGRALQELAAGMPWRDDHYAQISEQGIGRALRTRDWTYAVAAPPGVDLRQPWSDLYADEHLYDLRADPHQLRDLVDDPAYAGVRAELRGRLRARMAEAGEPAARIVPRA